MGSDNVGCVVGVIRCVLGLGLCLFTCWYVIRIGDKRNKRRRIRGKTPFGASFSGGKPSCAPGGWV